MIIAGCRSGEGKTTITLAILSYLAHQGHKIQSFKVGPDYIDPMFHSLITQRPCRNLDPVLTSGDYVLSCFARHSLGVDYTLIEGVMGLFDGSPRDDFLDFGSTAHISRLLNLPVILVINCASLSTSVAAIAHGYRSFDPRVKLAGVVLNRVASDRHLELLTQALTPLNLPILGVFRRQDFISLPSRHLGLVIPTEIANFRKVTQQLASLAASAFNWSELLPLLSPRNISLTQINKLPKENKQPVRIALARDRAFNFYYQDNLDLLEDYGAQLIPWSPLTDPKLPPNIQGIYFGGGYPEIFAEELAANLPMIHALRLAILTGIPTYAECGGLMYLAEKLIDLDNRVWDFLGILPTTAVMTPKLTLGYRQACAIESTPIVSVGELVWGHEFHRSQLTTSPTKPLWQIKANYEGWQLHNLHASYIHLHFGVYPHLVKRFVEKSLDRALRNDIRTF